MSTSFPCQVFLKRFHVIDRIPTKKNYCVREKKTANILIVDGQTCVRELLSKEMAHEGHRVSCFGAAKSILEYLGIYFPLNSASKSLKISVWYI
ncbi:MAG: hypothetical protein BA865_14750 [Desulfobacterales bacterium S5133MH4]|nr:MAG: hypothetical protein BA865_14750 [Desulfobacterales bacterium S5133MH4]